MGRKKINVIHNYFNYNPENKTSTCLKCDKILQGNHSSNLLRHFNTQHHNDYNEIVKTNQTNQSLQKHTDGNKLGAEIIKCCLDLVTKHGRPFAMLEDNAFQELLKLIPGSQSLSINAKSIKIKIADKAYEIRREIFNEIKNKCISLKADVGSVKTRRFLGLNIQYIKEDRIILRNLGVLELYQSNTGKYLKETITSVLSLFGIEIKQIYSTTTDNGSNMLSMSRHLQEALDEEFEDGNENNSEDFSPIEEDEYEQLINDLQFAEITDSDRYNLSPKVSAVRCAAHTLQLAVNDALKENQELLDTIRRAVRALRAPNIATQLRNLNLLQAMIDCPTRWDSTADMLERIVLLKNFCQTSSDQRINLSEHSWTDTEETLKALKCCRILSKRLQDEQLTFGDFYIFWMQCVLETEKLATPFSFLLCFCMKNRESLLFENESFLAAIYLDPRINFILEGEQLVTARNHLSRTFQRLICVSSSSNDRALSQGSQSFDNAVPCSSRMSIENDENSNTSVSHSEVVGAETNNQEAPLKEVDTFLGEMYLARHQDGTRVEFEISSHLVDFLKEPLLKSDSNILQYWHDKRVIFPHLHSLATIVLSTPPTQVSVERLFSSLKFVMNNLRMSLKDEHINDILVIRNNYLYSKLDS